MSADREQPGADPRVEHSRQAILAAALGELGAAGYGAFTIESVAAPGRRGEDDHLPALARQGRPHRRRVRGPRP